MYGGQDFAAGAALLMPGSLADRASRMGHVVDAVEAIKAALLADADETSIAHATTGYSTIRRDEFRKGQVVVEVYAYEATFSLQDVIYLDALIPGVMWHPDDEDDTLLFCTVPGRRLAEIRGEAGEVA